MTVSVGYPATKVSVSTAAKPWVNPGNVGAVDTTYAASTLPNSEAGTNTQLLRCTGFVFVPAVPSGATASSVTVRVRRRAQSGGGTVLDNDVYEYISGRTGSNLADASPWPNSDGDQIYTLGETAGAVLNGANYGIELDAQLGDDFSPDDTVAKIDVVEMTVTHTGGTLPPPPLPGTGGLNTGGAFLAAMVQQQLGCLLLAGLLGLAGFGIAANGEHETAAAAAIPVGSELPALAGPFLFGDRAVRTENPITDSIELPALDVFPPRRGVREVLPAALPFDTAADDQDKGEHGGQKWDG